MATNPRPALQTIIQAAETARSFLPAPESARRDRSPEDEEILLLQLVHAAEAVERLAPAVKAMRPEAPWLSVDVLRYIDPLRTRLSEIPVARDLMANEMQVLAEAAAGIIAQLDEHGIVGPRAASAPAAVYQFKITLAEITPPIWRRLLIFNTATLRRLHLAIQIVGGWWNYHLHLFEIAGTRYGPDPDGELGHRSDSHVRLAGLSLEPGSRFRYIYDLGDHWEHEVLLEKILSPDEAPSWPVCLGGERGFPHEDSGGVSGYYQTLRILRLKDHPAHKEMRAWAGPHYNPEGFDLDFVNEQLRTGKHRPLI